MKRTGVWIALALIAGVMAAEAQSGFGNDQGWRGSKLSGRGYGPRMVERMLRSHLLEEAGATEDQVEKVKALMYEHKKESIKLHADLELARLELEQLLEGSHDRTAVVAAAKKAGEYETAVKTQVLLLMMDIHDAVGEDIIEKVKAQVREKRMDRREQRRDRDDGEDMNPPRRRRDD